MQSQRPQRSSYRPSGRVDWPRFIPWALLIFLVALLIGAGLNWLYSTGWYILPVPILLGLFAGILVFLAVSRGNCRSPFVGTLFGFLTGILIYGGYFYFGMLSMLGPSAAARLDLLPRYIAMRARTDTTHDVSDSRRNYVAPDPYMNAFRYSFESLWILTFTTAAGYRRSRRSFCEQCGKWKHQDLAFFPPGNGRTIAGWLTDGTLHYLADVPPYSPAGRNRQSTLVALERCQPAQPGCAYYLAVKDATTSSGLGRFDGAFGRVRLPRVELSPDEVAALIPVFPANEPPPTPSTSPSKSPAAAAPVTAPGKSTRQNSELIEVLPIPPHEAHQVLTPLHITIANLLGLWILPAFYGGIIGCFVGFHYITQELNPRLTGPSHLLWWLIFTAASAFAAIFTGFVGLRNPGFAGNLYFKFLSRRSIARRPQKWVDLANTGGSPIYFVQVVPRQNWGTMKWETATDTGFLQIDAARNELRFEGDLHRYRIPTAAITDFSIASYGITQRIKYYVVLLQGLTASGPWEAPISLRPTNIFAAKDHRQQSAQMLYDQIAAVLPAANASFAQSSPANESVAQTWPTPQTQGLYAGTIPPAAAAQTSPPPLPPAMPAYPLPATPDYAHLRPSDLKPRTVWGPRIIWRLALFVLVVSIAIWRGAYVARPRIQQRTRVAQMMSAQSREPGPSAPRLPLTIKNLYFNQQLTETAPNHQPGGDWTILECTTSDNSAGFTLAIENKTPITPGGATSFQFKFTNLALLPSDRNTGANLIAQLAKTLNQPNPTVESPQPLTTTKYSAQVLGDNLGDPHVGLQPGRGSWTAIDWTIEQDGLGGQIFFNYNLYTRSAELVGANSDAIEAIASAIRDGPRPPRSEQNDPTFTSNAPILTDLKLIPGTKDCSGQFSRTGNLLLFDGGATPVTVHALDLRADRRLISIAQLDGRARSINSSDLDDNHFLIVETANADPLALGQEPEHRVWWLDRSTGQRTQLKGPWGTTGNAFGPQPISPDAKYCAICASSGTILDTRRSMSLYLVNLQTGDSVKVDGDRLTSGAWQGTGESLQFIASRFDAGQSQYFSIDPKTGHSSPTLNPSALDQTLSPDGKLIFHLDPKKSLTITPTPAGPSRTLTFAPLDRRFAFPGNFQWLSPRYIAFTTTHECFIDADQMKVGYLPAPTSKPITDDEDEEGYQFDRNFKWALAYTADGLTLGRVVTPQDIP
jgi:hypothetical protein